MPWFSRKKKKQKKVLVNSSKDDSVVTNAAKPSFAVVVQSFESSVSDQISVERGQVVEALFTEDDWIYVRDVNGSCGYVPGDFCFPLEKLRMGLPGDGNSERIRQLRVHPRPTTIHVDSFEGGPSCEVGGCGEVEGEEEEEVNSPDSGISCSHQASSSNMESVQSLHNTRERLTKAGENQTTHPGSHQRTADLGAESDKSHTHPIRSAERRKQFLIPNSSLPLLETATSSNPDPHSPSPPPLQPINLSDTPGHAHITMATVAEGDDRQSGSDGDDVFLPESNRPLGIYQCAENYQPRFEGEIPLQRDEIVVVLEAGGGEWVLAMGSEGKEGLVLKSLLHKYRPELPEEEEVDIGEEVCGDEVESETREGVELPVESENLTSSSATQTELIIDGVVHELTSTTQPPTHDPNVASSSSSAAAAGTTSVSIQTEFTLPNWFRNNTPVATPNNTLTRSSSGNCTDCHTITTGTSPPHPHQNHRSHTENAGSDTSAHPHRNHGSHADNADSPPHGNSAPLRLLCNPHSSQSSSDTPSTRHSDSTQPRPSGGDTPSGRRLPLTPVSTPPRPSVTLQTPNGTHSTQLTNPTPHTPTNITTAADRHTECGTTRQGQRSMRVGGAVGGVRAVWTGTMQRHRQALQQHARIIDSIRFDPDNEAGSAHNRSSSARRRMQPTPIVTATRDYSPPQRAKNALVLRRGEIMYAQPHVPFPHGWVWVYHTLHKRYGYVPKDHIAYMYLVQKDQGTVLEDVV